MTPNIAKQVEALGDMTAAELRERHLEVFGEESRSRHNDFLRKRIAWRLQANDEGGLSERARRRAESRTHGRAVADEQVMAATGHRGGC